MLHGAKISDSKSLKTAKLFEQSSGEFATFHLSAAILDKCSDPKAKVRLVVKLEEKYKNQEVTLAVLSKENEVAQLSLYMNCTQQLQLFLKNAPKDTEVSLSGYFEPKGDDMDDDMFGYGQEEADEDLEDDSGSDEEDENEKGLVVQGKAIGKKQESKALSASLKEATQNKNKNAAPSAAAYGDSDDDEEEGEDEEIDSDLVGDDSDEEEDSDEEQEVKQISGKK